MLINLKTIKKVYINLDSQPLKKKQTENLFHNLNYNNYERFSAIIDNSYCSSGCSLSHRQVLLNYYNEYPLIIFEDDNKICDWYSQYIPENGIIDIPDDCDIFYLGYSVAEGVESSGRRPLSCSFLSNKIVRLHGSLTAHAIIFFNEKAKKEAIEAINTYINKKRPADVGYYDMLPRLNAYAFTSAIFYQSGVNCKYTNVRLYNDNGKYYNVYSEQNNIIERGNF